MKDMLIGGIVGGLGSAGFYGAGKALDALKSSVVGRRNSGTLNDGLGALDWKHTNRKAQTALEHVQKHGIPNYQREMHGVFRSDIQTVVESAWANRGNARVIADGMGGIVYNIPYQNVGYNTGYINFGQQMNYVTIVVQEGRSLKSLRVGIKAFESACDLSSSGDFDFFSTMMSGWESR